jgi:GAF domain-containing protein
MAPDQRLASVSPIRGHDGTIVGAAKIARDVTLQRRADVEQQATLRRLLYAVGQAVAAELDRERVLQTITDAARDLSGAQFGAFFYNVTDAERGHYLLYTLSGAPRAAFEHFGAPRNTGCSPRRSPARTSCGWRTSARIPATATTAHIMERRSGICR